MWLCCIVLHCICSNILIEIQRLHVPSQNLLQFAECAALHCHALHCMATLVRFHRQQSCNTVTHLYFLARNQRGCIIFSSSILGFLHFLLEIRRLKYKKSSLYCSLWQNIVYPCYHIMLVSLRWTPDMLCKLQTNSNTRRPKIGVFICSGAISGIFQK